MKCLLFTLILLTIANSSFASQGILLLAHGTMSKETPADRCRNLNPSKWEQAILESVRNVEPKVKAPVEVAFGMWNSTCYDFSIAKLQARLDAKGESLDHLTILPLFISSHSLVIEMQKFIFKQRNDKVIDFPNVNQILFDKKISYLKAIDYDPLVSRVVLQLADDLVQLANAKSLHQNNLDLILVMHGPIEAEDNLKWLAMGEAYTKDIRAHLPFLNTNVLSLQDDADKETRDAATQRLRNLIIESTANHRRTLILPLLLAPGGIQWGIQDRLKNLNYVWTGQALFPNLKIEDFLLSRLNDLTL